MRGGVGTVFRHESGRTNRQSEEYCVKLIGRLPIDDGADDRMVGEGCRWIEG